MPPEIRLSLPARINIVGSPTDAVEGAYATISAAVNLRGGAEIGPATAICLQRGDAAPVQFPPARIDQHGGFNIEAAALNAMLRFAPQLGGRLATSGFRLRTWTDVPPSSGLAGSSVLLLAVLAALRAFYRLDPVRYNDYVLAEVAQRAEEHDLGVVCGFADRYVPLFGDIAYLGYHGKLWHAELGEEPFATYEKLGNYVPPLEFCVATTGVQRDSGGVHAPMRARYLEERRRGMGPMLSLARQLGETAWRGKIALLAGDLVDFGKQIDRNQTLVDEMMRLCGFAAGAGEEVNLLVAAARAGGALGAKLTGAGGGGAIFALPSPGHAHSLAESLSTAASRAGLEHSEVFQLTVERQGLVVQESPNGK